MGLQKILLWYPISYSGLPFAAPLAKGLVLVPAAIVGGLWLFQYGLTSNIYYDEFDGEAREQNRPKIA